MGDLFDWLFDPVVILVGIVLVVLLFVFGIPTCGLHKNTQDPGQAVVVQQPATFPYVTATICLTAVLIVFIVSYYKYRIHKERLAAEQARAYEETVRREFERQDNAYRDAVSPNKKDKDS